MKTKSGYTAVLLLIAVLVVAPVEAGWPPTMRVAIPIVSANDMLRLYQLRIYLVGREPAGDLLAEVDASDYAALLSAGFSPRVVLADLRTERDEILAAGRGDDSEYHSYAEVTADLQALAANHPDICAIGSAGQSIQGREQWIVKISDNVTVNEAEPGVRFDGNIHGDEKISQEVAYLFAESLVEDYGTDPTITGIVDHLEIWIMPCVNPDGMTMGTRYNANGVDCNRDYGIQWNGDGGSSSPFSQQETRNMAEYILARPYVMSMTYHSGTELFIWSWCYTDDRPPSYMEHSHIQTNYSALSDYSGGQCGWVLYNVNGGSMDYDLAVNGALGQCVELSYTKTPPASQIDSYFNRNVEGTWFMLEEAAYGIHGTITGTGGQPVAAIARVEMYNDLGGLAYADPELGDLHKYLRPGTYDLLVWANDHEPQMVPGLIVQNQAVTSFGVQLTPAGDGYVYRVIICNDTSYGDTNHTITFDAVGPPDGAYYSIGVNGYIVLDMGENTAIWDRDGIDFTVVEGDGTAEGYEVRAAADWRGPWFMVGTGSGTQDFDLGVTPLDEARYIKLIDDGDGSSTAADPGFDLDAIVTTHIVPGCGFLVLDAQRYACDATVGMELIDADMNLHPGQLDEVTVQVTSDSDPTGESVTLVETAPDSGDFTGAVGLTGSGGAGMVTVSHDDTLMVTYQDADCQGAPQVVSLDAVVDCESPLIIDVQVVEVSAESAELTWETDEPAAGLIRYGDTYPPQMEVTAGAFTTAHMVRVEGLENCTYYIFEVEAVDEAGNSVVDDHCGEFYHFTTLERHILLQETMDADPGWNTQGQWAWGQPTGQGGEYGEPDPTSGYTGSTVCGYNLNGDYPNSMPVYYLTTTVFDCSEAQQVTLEFERWLGVEQPTYDHASLQVSGNGGASWQEVWQNTSTLNGGAWEHMSHELTQWAAGHAAVQVRWGMGPTDSGWRYCGWNIDDVVLSYTTECVVDTPTPRPATATPPPGTPTWALPTETPPMTPPATPTPGGQPDTVVLDLVLNQDMFHANDPFVLGRRAWNPGPVLTLEEWIVLDVYGAYWFWPDWTMTPDSALVTLPSREYVYDVRLQFQWPEGDYGSLTGLLFWGAFIEPGTANLVGEYDWVTFGFD
ncbi:hypothetical protein JW905_09665 [bacterium]|nr:hypothetical protein [candidate division CSSED10-310 bacterium]